MSIADDIVSILSLIENSAQECTEFPEACHANATCKEFHYRREVAHTNYATGEKTWRWTTETIHRCVCNSGHIGNGVTCADATTGTGGCPQNGIIGS